MLQSATVQGTAAHYLGIRKRKQLTALYLVCCYSLATYTRMQLSVLAFELAQRSQSLASYPTLLSSLREVLLVLIMSNLLLFVRGPLPYVPAE